MGFWARAMLTYLAAAKPFQNVTQPGPPASVGPAPRAYATLTASLLKVTFNSPPGQCGLGWWYSTLMMDALIEATATSAFILGVFGLPVLASYLYELRNPPAPAPELDSRGFPRNVRVRK